MEGCIRHTEAQSGAMDEWREELDDVVNLNLVCEDSRAVPSDCVWSYVTGTQIMSGEVVRGSAFAHTRNKEEVGETRDTHPTVGHRPPFALVELIERHAALSADVE